MKSIWQGSCFWEIMKKARGLSLVDIAEMMVTMVEKEEYNLWCIILWKIWSYVCGLRHKKTDTLEAPTVEDSRAFLEAYIAAKPTYGVDHWLGMKLGSRVWVKPKHGRYRVDVDARYDVENREYGAGIIVRDHDGKMVVAAAKKTLPATSSMMAEVMAVIHGIILCIEQNIAPMEVYIDYVLAARAMMDEVYTDCW